MTATQQFIEDAIKGRWKPTKYIDYSQHEQVMGLEFVIANQLPEKALLDPLAWQAVGKTRGWDENVGYRRRELPYLLEVHATEANLKQLQFVQHLADGKTIEQALAELTPTAGEAVTSE